MEKSDLIIFATPVFVYHVTGQMKTLLDHFAFQWMIHRPNEKMFKKQALIIPSIKVKGLFYAMRLMHKKIELSKIDKDYWAEKGWLGKKRPWK
ncbi:NAD(P)H-dependent oxidoreductase [Clostridium sp. B9]|uniref:NAD(P)H-dependent oxidoreductase n=1 Tax=Clostridium sp. B9 TaxID=3423224 RepID=UPI003D2EB8A2